jgi:hypothetical protein
MATMSVRNNLINTGIFSTPDIINSTNFYINNKFLGSITQYPAAGPFFGGVNQYQTRQFFTILYRGVDYSAGGVSNVEFTCSLEVTAGIDSSQTQLGDYNTYLTAVGLY